MHWFQGTYMATWLQLACCPIYTYILRFVRDTIRTERYSTIWTRSYIAKCVRFGAYCIHGHSTAGHIRPLLVQSDCNGDHRCPANPDWSPFRSSLAIDGGKPFPCVSEPFWQRTLFDRDWNWRKHEFDKNFEIKLNHYNLDWIWTDQIKKITTTQQSPMFTTPVYIYVYNTHRFSTKLKPRWAFNVCT